MPMISKNSPKSRITLLRGDGSVEALPLRPAPFQPGFIVLARERCLFERLDVAPGLNGRAAAAAARLHAETQAPYQRYGALITHKGSSFGIWWWDAQWVGEKLGGHGLDPLAKVIPEPLMRAVGDGWRIVRASSGYEAQLWKNGFLHADLWRRSAFDTAAWQDFVRVQAGESGGESAVLMAQEAPWTANSPYRRTILSDWTPQKTGQMAIAATIALALCGSLYFAGEAVGLKRDAARMEAAAAELKAALPKGSSGPNAGELNALRDAVGGADPLVMLQAAQEKIEPFGHKLVAFKTSRDEVRLVLPGEAAEDIDIMSRELADSAYFSDVRPMLNEKDGKLTIALTAKGARPKAKARTASQARAVPGG